MSDPAVGNACVEIYAAVARLGSLEGRDEACRKARNLVDGYERAHEADGVTEKDIAAMREYWRERIKREGLG